MCLRLPFPSSSISIEHSLATSFTNASDWWMLSWSTTKIHSPSGSVAMVFSM